MKLLLTSCLLALSLEAQEVLAIVNGHKITDEVAPKNFKELPQQQQKQILNRLIEKYLAAEYALQSDVIKSEAFQKVYTHVIGYSTNNPEKITDILKQKNIKGYTNEQLQSKKGLLAFDFLVEEKAKTIKPTQEELQAYYNARKYKYDTPHMIELSSIVVDTKKDADKVYNELKTNKKVTFNTFFELAKKYSKSPDAVDGGYLGKIAVNDLNDVIKKDIMQHKQGEYTQPIKTEFGYQIYYIINNIPEVKTTLTMVKDRVKDEYIQEKVKEWAFVTINKLKSKAKIEVLTN